jgi:hypothetical protein
VTTVCQQKKFLFLIAYSGMYIYLLYDRITATSKNMKLQAIQDGYGNNTGVFVPINDWDVITQKHPDLKELVTIEPAPKKKLSELAGTLSKETGEAMLNHVAEGRGKWDERLKN